MRDPETKEDRIEKARIYIKQFTDQLEEIQNDTIRTRVEVFIEALRQLRDMQYLFDSGERQIVQLYKRYLPYLSEILTKYITIESSGNYEAVRKARSQLIKTMDLLIKAVAEIQQILPQDEMEEANATAMAQNMKEMFDALTKEN